MRTISYTLINVPADMGDEFEVIVLPLRPELGKNALSDDEQFMLAAYFAVIDNDPEEDAIWGHEGQALHLTYLSQTSREVETVSKECQA